MMSIADVLAAIAIAINVAGGIIALTWGVGRVRTVMQEQVEAHRRETDHRFDKFRDEIRETFGSMRHKIEEVELFGRDNYVRIPIFVEAINSVNLAVAGGLDKVDRRIERLEGKIDSWMTKKTG